MKNDNMVVSSLKTIVNVLRASFVPWGGWWPGGRASDSRPRGPGIDPQ